MAGVVKALQMEDLVAIQEAMVVLVDMVAVVVANAGIAGNMAAEAVIMAATEI